MSSLAQTPSPPYYAVIFTSLRTDDAHGYEEMAEKMVELASTQPGFLGIESVNDSMGITVSYWTDLESIRNWKENPNHRKAQQLGHEKWYEGFKIRISKVERDYGM